GPIDMTAWFVEALLASPGRTMNLLPGGTARAEKLVDLPVGSGAAAQTITAWAVTGLTTSPPAIWADANNRFFGGTSCIAGLPAADASEQGEMEDAQAKARAARAPALAKALATVPAGAVAFTGARVFDSDGLRFVPDQTVIVEKGLIAAVGSRDAVSLPSGA